MPSRRLTQRPSLDDRQLQILNAELAADADLRRHDPSPPRLPRLSKPPQAKRQRAPVYKAGTIDAFALPRQEASR
jgi:hypothetical protein